MIRIFKEIDNKAKIEGKIIDLFSETSGGQLTVFKPTEKGSVADLIVKRRGEYYKGSPAYLHIRECKKDSTGSFFIDQIKEGEVPEDPDLYLVFLYFDIVHQDISSYIWLIPTMKFFEIAKGSDNVFEFSASIDPKVDSGYKRYLIPKNELPKILFKIIEEGSKFMFPSAGFSGLVDIKIAELKQFIINARQHTYAGGGAASDNPRLRGSKELSYQKGDWAYQDIYFSGKNNLIGQETVYYSAKPVWAMGYFGDQLEEKPTEFLKYVLFNEADKCRLGQALEIKKKDYLYQDQGSGTIEKFEGEEKIYSGGKEIYKLNYRGGLIIK